MIIDFSSLESVKGNYKALAILLDIKFHTKRTGSSIKNDLNLTGEEAHNIITALDNYGFIRPNPHRNVDEIKYVLTEKGFFLLNEVEAENPEIKEIFKDNSTP